ncbi:hypothetical protein M422DRAFT_26177 [Sphaerobolus stellatus SS14]|nr:hypothetical protein M422DRAFT_26177 [Sphaerobolus stellatus SS14]
MKLSTNFSILLATLFTAFGDAEAAPSAKRPSRMITLPIRSLHGRVPDGVHPSVYLQQNINRAERRLARMSGREAPSDHVLRDRLEKRMYIVGANHQVDSTLVPGGKTQKRYTPISSQLDAWRAKQESQKETRSIEARRNRHGKGGGKGNGANSAANAAATATAAATDVTTTAAAESTNAAVNPGVSDADIQAALNSTLTIANPPTAGDSLGLNIEGPDTGYVAEVQIGTPPTTFQILMDSGSADFWVGSETCTDTNGNDCGPHQFLGPNSSSSFQQSASQFQVTYGTGSVNGTIIKDDVLLAGLSLPGHIFGVANLESVDFSSNTTRFDGLMGLAQSGLSQQGVPTPVESLASAGLISKAITSYKISRLADGKNDGEITFGGLDNTKFDSATLVTVPNVNTQGFWEGNLDAVSVDGTDLGLQGRTAILDTGTTTIIAPAADAAAIHAQIEGASSDGQGGFIIPCTTTASVALTFGGTSFAIDPRDLAFLPVDANNPTGNCSSGISSGQIGGANEWLVGDVFLKNAYFSTDVTDNTLSLAKLV